MTVPAVGAATFKVGHPVPQAGGELIPTVTLVSRYRLDAGSAADDLGGVNGTVVGIWTATNLNSMASGIAGTSMYKIGGTAAITLPANNAVHDLDELSLTFYFQPSGNTNKHTLFACAPTAGNVAGDFSIERLTNGRLRGWHVGQDNVLRFFESTDGIAATNLVVGTAYRITLTLGAFGARLYLNGTEVSSILQNTNGWNNTRVKYVGMWVDGSQSPAEGVFDHITVRQGELTQGGEAVLAAPVSVTIPDDPFDDPFPFVTTWAPAINHTGMATRPAYNAGNPAATALTDPMSGLQIIRLGGNPGDTVFRYTAAGAAVNTGLVFPNCLRNPNTPTAFKAINSDGTLIHIGEFFNVGTQPAGTLCRSYIIDVTGQYSGGVAWRIIRASATADFGEGGSFQFWDETNPFRMFVKLQSGQINAWYPIGTTGQSPAGPGTVNTWIAAPAAYNQFVTRNSDGNNLGRDHDNVTTRDGRYHMAGCNRISDGLWGGIRIDLINQQYVNPFVASQAGQQSTTRPTMRQIDSRTGRYCFQQGIGGGGSTQTGVDIQTSSFLSTTPSGYSHPCMIDVNGVDFIFGVQGNTIQSAMWNIAAGTNRTVAQIPQANPTHVTPLLGDRFETNGGTGSGATSGDRYVIQAISTTAGGGMRSIVGIRCGPSDTNVVRFICDPRGVRTANHNEMHPQAWFSGNRGFVLFPSSWNFQGNYNDSHVSPYVAVLPPGWASANNDGS